MVGVERAREVLEGGALSPPPTGLEHCGDDKASPSIE
jgi:hypothetical protein